MAKCRAFVVTVLLPGVLGCVAAFAESEDCYGSLGFSPDSSTLAYVHSRLSIGGVGPEPVKVRQTAEVCWCTAAQASRVTSMPLDEFGRSKSGYWLYSGVHLAFSPDSRRLAVATPTHLRVIDLASSSSRVLTARGELVTGMAWRDNRAIVYAAHTNRRGEYDELTDRTFWVQDVANGPDNRTSIYTEKGVDGAPAVVCDQMDWPFEHLSPNGRYCVFAEAGYTGPLCLLDCEGGGIQRFDSLRIAEVSWKPDSSAVACVTRSMSILLEPSTGKVTDFTARLDELLGPGVRVFHVEPVWTPDNRYLVCFNLDLMGFLMRPDPWEVIPVGRRFSDLVEPGARGEGAEIFPQPVPGWVTASGGRPWQYFAVDYEGKHVVPLGGPSECGVALSPDGRLAARVEGGKVPLTRVTLAPSDGEPPAE